MNIKPYKTCMNCNGTLKVLRRLPSKGIHSYQCLNCGLKQRYDRYSKKMVAVKERNLFCPTCKSSMPFTNMNLKNKDILQCPSCGIKYSEKGNSFYTTQKERETMMAKRFNEIKRIQRRVIIPIIVKRDSLDGIECTDCGKKLTEETADLDHIIPIPFSWVGRKETWKNTDNLEILCRACNARKGKTFDRDFVRDIMTNPYYSDLNPDGLDYESWFEENMEC